MQQTTTKIPKGYKQTEIGVIPEDWDVKKLGDCLVKPPRYGIGAAAVEYSDQLPKYIRITDISEAGRFLPDKIVSVDNLFSANYFLSEGDLVVARTGASVGKSYLYRPEDGPLVFAGFLICVSSNKNILLPQYLGNYFKTMSFWNWVRLTSMRSGQPGINGNEYARLLIPLPKIAEQTAIATVLSDTDALIERLEKLIAKKKAIKQGAMQQLLTPPIAGQAGKKRLPGFSGDWEVKVLGDVAAIVMGQSPSSSYYNNKGIGIPLIQGNADVAKRQTIKRIFTSVITKKGKSGDILMSVRAPVGEISRTVFDVCLGRGVCAIRYPNDFLYHYLIFKEKTWVKLSKGSTFDSVNSSDVRAFEIQLPTDDSEQVAIATILSDMDTEIESLEKKRDKYTMLKQGMMQELLTGKTRLI